MGGTSWQFEKHELGFVNISMKAKVGEPVEYKLSGTCKMSGGSSIGGASHIDGTIVHI